MSGWLMGICCVSLLGLYSVLLIQSLRVRRSARFQVHVDPFIVLLRFRPIYKRVHPLLNRPKLSLSLLNGGTCSSELLMGWAGESVGIAYVSLLVTAMLAVLSENPTLLYVGIMIAGCLPVLRTKELFNKVNKRRQSIVMELPELLSKLLLMVNAGENVMRALDRVVEQKQDTEHPLYVELKAAIAGMKRGESLSVALEEMGRRCAVPEVKLFATTLLINARRGGDAFVPALREITRQMWDKRKAIARTLGEQASSRLAFPLTLVFLLIMVLVGAPTMLMM
ncbi:type II secretion system F family protein [Cohnella sp. WQ 127256]|uniref:type II secretion system F family protein n=1 Tax=Cohnella sp. WQ 127256 TaxID=2938790 RepID=UPI00211954C6|nr:type II secretion system F family protein [Cohnella sp. WQ 127256]